MMEADGVASPIVEAVEQAVDTAIETAKEALRQDVSIVQAGGVPLGAVFALLAALVAILALVRIIFSGPKRDAVLVVGPCGAGKTSLFCRVRSRRATVLIHTSGSELRDDSAALGTVTSMKENAAALTVKPPKESRFPPREVRLVDLPGHPRLRGKIDAFVPSARKIVFMVDGRDPEFLAGARDTAELLFDVLSHPLVAGRRLPLLLAVNKTDKGPACHSVEFVRKRLERELDQLRDTRGALAEAGGDRRGGGVKLLGRAGVPFAFSQLPNSVSVVGVSVATDDLAALREFIIQR